MTLTEFYVDPNGSAKCAHDRFDMDFHEISSDLTGLQIFGGNFTLSYTSNSHISWVSRQQFKNT